MVFRSYMARLQKKKPLGEKKKKSTELEAAVETGAAPRAAKPAAAILPKQEKAAAEVKEGAGNLFQQGLEFFREVKVELNKVTWPTRKQTTGTTVVVILFVFVVAAFLGLFDYSLSKLVQLVLT